MIASLLLITIINLIFFCVVLGIKPRDSCMLAKHSTTEVYRQPQHPFKYGIIFYFLKAIGI